jgi:hypothetical protein
MTLSRLKLMNKEDKRLRVGLTIKHPHVSLLIDEEATIGLFISSVGRSRQISTARTSRAMETAEDLRSLAGAQQSVPFPSSSQSPA